MTDRRAYAILAAAAAAFVVYGSLVPFHFAARPFADVSAELERLVGGGVVIASRSDFAANAVLGVPLAFCLMGLASGRACPGRVPAGLWVVAACVALAVVVELAQLYFPGRTPAVSDVLAQGVGAVVGVVAWLAVGQRLTDAVQRTEGRGRGVLVAYLAFMLLVQLLPMDLSASPYAVYRKLRDGHATLTPFAEWFRTDGPAAPNRWGKVQTWIELFGLYLPLGMLASRWRAAGLVPAGLALALAMEAAQLSVSRHPSVTDAIVGWVGVVVGWAVARIGPVGLERALVLGQLWFAVLAVAHWQPFDFGPPRGADSVTWVPFADLVARNAFGALDQALVRAVLFVPVGVLVAATGRRPWVAAVVAAGMAAALELGQVMLPGRYPSTSDLPTAALGAWLGAVVRHRRVA